MSEPVHPSFSREALGRLQSEAMPNPKAYAQQTYRKHFLESVQKGLEDVKAGWVVSGQVVKRRLARLVLKTKTR